MTARFGVQKTFAWALCIGMIASLVLSLEFHVPALSQTTEDDAQIAKSLATMLRAGRTVISRNQDRINDAALGPKGLEGKTVVAESINIYQETTNIDPL